MEPETVSRSQRYLSLAQAFRLPEAGTASDLGLSTLSPSGVAGQALAYTRLFLGPGRPIAHPYESVYVEGQLMGESTAQVAQCYAEAGLQVSTADPSTARLSSPKSSLRAGRELPDHVSLELAFMAHLASQEECDPDQAQVWRQRQRHFLRQHLARWLPQFCRKIEESQVHPFYCKAAQAARRLIEEDLVHLAMAGPSAIRNTQYPIPDISLSVASSLCTLCTLCADNCRPGALTVDCTPTTLSLAFDPARCNGCRACLRLCPEGAITIESCDVTTQPFEAASSLPALVVGPGSLVEECLRRKVIATAPRVVCPGCHRPHIAAPWLERLAEQLGGAPSIRRSLALCPLCKQTTGDECQVERHSSPATRHSLEVICQCLENLSSP